MGPGDVPADSHEPDGRARDADTLPVLHDMDDIEEAAGAARRGIA